MEVKKHRKGIWFLATGAGQAENFDTILSSIPNFFYNFLQYLIEGIQSDEILERRMYNEL